MSEPLNVMAFEIYKILIERNVPGVQTKTLAKISYDLIQEFIVAGKQWQIDREAYSNYCGPGEAQWTREWLDSIHSLDLPIRAKNALEMESIYTIADLCKFTGRELLRLPNFGKKCLEEVKHALFVRNLHLAG